MGFHLSDNTVRVGVRKMSDDCEREVKHGGATEGRGGGGGEEKNSGRQSICISSAEIIQRWSFFCLT